MQKRCEWPPCQALRGRYSNDPDLLRMYERKLLSPGWAGETDAVEKAYILAHAKWAQVGAARLTKDTKRPAVSPTNTLPHDGCTCPACLALAAEYGIGTDASPLNERMYQVVRRRLLVRGWAGGMTDVERDYLRAHPPKWYAQAAGQGRRNLDRESGPPPEGALRAG